MKTINEIAIQVAEKHITKHNATFEIIKLTTNENYLVIVNHPSTSIEELISISGLTPSVAEEYVYCRIHGIAAKLISKLHPKK